MTQEIDAPRLKAYARRYLRRFRHTSYTADDLVQDCWVAYLQGQDYYHARIVDAMRLWHEATDGWHGNRFRSYFSLIHVPKNHGAFCTTERDLARAETAELVRQAVDRLPPRERLVVYLTWWDERSAIDIGRIIGRVPCLVSQIRTKALGRIKRRIIISHQSTATHP